MSEKQYFTELNGVLVKDEEARVEIEQLNDDKLDKNTSTTQTSQVYAKTASGEQQMLDVSTEANASNIVQRKNNGNVTVPETPAANTDAASKKYVDSKAGGTTLYKHEIAWSPDGWDEYIVEIIATSNERLSQFTDFEDIGVVSIRINNGTSDYISVIDGFKSDEHEFDYYGDYITITFWYFDEATRTEVMYNELYGKTNDEDEEYFPDSWSKYTVTKL